MIPRGVHLRMAGDAKTLCGDDSSSVDEIVVDSESATPLSRSLRDAEQEQLCVLCRQRVEEARARALGNLRVAHDVIHCGARRRG